MNIVIIGGSGARNTLKALENRKDQIYNIVTMFDSGGSTGYLRRKFGIYALGDLRDRILAVSKNELLKEISKDRINLDESHNLGNLILFSLIRLFNQEYIEKAKELYWVPENIHFVPIIDNVFTSTTLVLETDKGKLYGENVLDEKSNEIIKIFDVKLTKEEKIGKEAKYVIESADYLIFGPGDLYSSIIPSTLVNGFKDAINKSKGKVVLIVNIMNKQSETYNYKASDFVKIITKYAKKPDIVIVNNKRIENLIMQTKYSILKGFVENDVNAIECDLINEKMPWEHDPIKLRKILDKVLV